MRSKTPEFGRPMPTASSEKDKKTDRGSELMVLDGVVMKHVGGVLRFVGPVTRVICCESVQDELWRGSHGPSKAYRLKCKMIRSIFGGEYSDAAQYCQALIEYELDILTAGKQSTLRSMLRGAKEQHTIDLSYDQIERIVSGCLEEIIQNSEASGRCYKHKYRISFLGNSFPFVLDFLTSRGRMIEKPLSMASFSAKDIYCMEVRVYYDFNKIIQIPIFGTKVKITNLNYEYVYNKIKTSIPYNFVFVKKTYPDSVFFKYGRLKFKLPLDYTLTRSHKQYNPLRPLNIRHILISRVVPEVIDFDDYDFNFISSRVFYLKLRDSNSTFTDGQNYDKTAVFMSIPAFGFKPVADALLSLLKESLDTEIDFEKINDVLNPIKRINTAFHDIDLGELLSSKVPEFKDVKVKPDEDPLLLDCEDELREIIQDETDFKNLMILRPDLLILTISYSSSADASAFSDKLSLDSGSLVYTLTHTTISNLEDEDTCCNFRRVSNCSRIRSIQNTIRYRVHYFEKTTG